MHKSLRIRWIQSHRPPCDFVYFLKFSFGNTLYMFRVPSTQSVHYLVSGWKDFMSISSNHSKSLNSNLPCPWHAKTGKIYDGIQQSFHIINSSSYQRASQHACVGNRTENETKLKWSLKFVGTARYLSTFSHYYHVITEYSTFQVVIGIVKRQAATAKNL